jgi:signal transduction histidine kinase
VSLRREAGERADGGNVEGEADVDGGNVESEADADGGTGADRFVLTVADDGPGIPDHEVTAVESGRETALEHGSGLGLWVVEWGAAALGAEVDYADREPRGTTVTVRIPVVAEP